MKATILIPVAALLVAGAATAAGISMTSSADDVPASPIVVTAPQRVPAAPAPAGTGVPAAPGPARVTAEPKAPPTPVDVPAPPPAISDSDDDWDDDSDDDWDDDWDDDGGWDD